MKLFSQKVINNIKSKIEDKKFQNSLPSNYKVEDIFLVSFPKSGNTWLRFLIANAIKVHFSIETEVNFFSILEIIPAVKNKRYGNVVNLNPLGIFGRADLPRLIKSHDSYNPYFNRVILLVRDPRDVICSWFRYLKNYQKIESDTRISDFLNHPRYGIHTWVNHTESWYFNQRIDQIIKIFRYEDLLQDTSTQLQLIMELLGVKMTRDELSQAIELSSKEEMKKSEDAHMSNFYLDNRQIPFVDKGESRKGKDLAESDRLIVEQKTRIIASKLGYKY